MEQEHINDQPGPELDRRIHEVVFHIDTSNYQQEGKILRRRRKSGVIESFPLPEYSTTWNGMQLVVEEMRRRNWQLVLNDDLDKWTAIYFWDPNGSSYEAESESAPHAVCMAALSALSALEGQEDG